MGRYESLARLNRRETLGLIGVGGVGLLTSLRDAGFVSAELHAAARQAASPAYPTGAIVRTILRDVSPDQLGAGATFDP